MSEQHIVSLDEYADLITGYPFKSSEYTDDPSGIRLLRGDNVVQGKLRWDGAKRWPKQLAPQHKEFELSLDDVVLAMDRPWIEAGLKYAAIREADLPTLLVQRVARLRAKPGLDQTFLRYLVGSRQFTEHVLAVQTGTAVPHISPTQIREFRFKYLPLAVQQGIGDFLDVLDNSLDLNDRILALCEETLQACFDLVARDSPIGCFGDLLTPYRQKIGNTESVQVLSAVSSGELVPSDTFFNKRVYSESTHNYLQVPLWGVAYNPSRVNIGSIGMNYFANAGAVSPVYVVLRASEESAWWVRQELRSPSVKADIEILSSGSVRQNLSQEDFLSIDVRVPSPTIARMYEKLRGPIWKLRESVLREQLCLSSLREALLPRLLDGDVTVRRARDRAAEPA